MHRNYQQGRIHFERILIDGTREVHQVCIRLDRIMRKGQIRSRMDKDIHVLIDSATDTAIENESQQHAPVGAGGREGGWRESQFPLNLAYLVKR